MTKTEYDHKIDALFQRWKQARPDYGNNFVHDGIADFDKWRKAKPKVLFLLKETYLYQDWEPYMGITNTTANPFSKNIARWHNAVKELFQDYSKEPSYDVNSLPKEIKDIALLELKKVNQGKSTSESRDINQFARNDKMFIQEQIELIDPQIIVCCGTIYAYEDIVYGNEDWDHIFDSSGASLLSGSGYKRYCYQHRGRLVIDFYHPSARKKQIGLMEMLCRMIKNGKVFDPFVWANTKPA